MSSELHELHKQVRALAAERDALKLLVDELSVELKAAGGSPKRASSSKDGGDGELDSQWYEDHYADVRELGMDPADHFNWIGRRLGRAPNAKALKKKQRRDAGFWQIHR